MGRVEEAQHLAARFRPASSTEYCTREAARDTGEVELKNPRTSSFCP